VPAAGQHQRERAGENERRELHVGQWIAARQWSRDATSQRGSHQQSRYVHGIDPR
jgi:hypothetical protein